MKATVTFEKVKFAGVPAFNDWVRHHEDPEVRYGTIVHYDGTGLCGKLVIENNHYDKLTLITKEFVNNFYEHFL